MTANVDIKTAEKQNVLYIPYRAVKEKDGGRIVEVLENGQLKEVSVVVGLRGDEGVVEIISGLSEGQNVITFIREK